MKYSRRVNRLFSACAGIALAACAGEIEMVEGDAPTATDTLSPAAYGSPQQPAAPASTTAQVPSRTTQPSTTAPASTTSTPAPARTSGRSTSPSTTVPAPTTTSSTPVAPAPVAPAPVAPAPVSPAPVVLEPSAPPVVQPTIPVVPTRPAQTFAWTDDIQTSDRAPWGFNQVTLERPIGSTSSGNNEVNLLRVPNPIGEGYAIKHTATFDDNGGSRSQAGIYSFANDTFNDLAKSEGGIYIAQEWYFPQTLSAGDLGSRPWANLWDWHSVGPSGSDRWDTQPGLMLAQDGSMKVKWSWRQQNRETEWSEVELPVGQWFDIEMHYVWSASGTTVSLWVNGELALQQSGVKTKGGSHSSIETYMKFYGSANGGPSWSPAVKYTRNVRMSAERIWR